MFSALVNAWKIPELRKKILFTLLMIGVDLIYAFIDPRIRAKYSKRR